MEIHHGGDGSATRVLNVKLESMMFLFYIKLQRLQTFFYKGKIHDNYNILRSRAET